MEVKSIDSKTIYGICTRTNNATEMSPNGKIPALWQTFDRQVAVDYPGGERVYGAYFDYASDQHGDFTVLAGYDAKNSTPKAQADESLTTITIPSGRYLVFRQQGEMPQIAIDVWTEVWHFFEGRKFEGEKLGGKDVNTDTPRYQRLFTTDFEYYPNANEIEVYIAIADEDI
ncbi:AraC family transcriptional regulator [Thalassotalea euphylliae]|uniref:AraC family transcriptional regulator n=1 Tax=Thalassotalea euphylliae TaxID=1655234 RepID=A0A3E0TTV1_9GAMM|nr:effector binding domain-containing protein [Thalassotalea euphylliae]REL28111.1 AraC family transcriptional regulator [Thalassotalea euphylliae]